MELKTQIAMLQQQVQDCMNICASIQQLGFTASQLVNAEEPYGDINPQIKSLMASAGIQMTALNSQDVLVQQTIDAIAALVS